MEFITIQCRLLHARNFYIFKELVMSHCMVFEGGLMGSVYFPSPFRLFISKVYFQAILRK